jgi:hypothetical protein
MSEVGVTVEVLRDKGDTSLVEERMDDVRGLLASLSGWCCQRRSQQNPNGSLHDAAARSERG